MINLRFTDRGDIYKRRQNWRHISKRRQNWRHFRKRRQKWRHIRFAVPNRDIFHMHKKNLYSQTRLYLSK